MGDVIVKAFLAYLAKNPQLIERLVELLLGQVVAHLEAQQAKPTA